MPYYACPNCGSSASSVYGPPPVACPRCCARLRAADDVAPPYARQALLARRPTPAVKVPIGAGRASPTLARHALRELGGELAGSRMRVCELLVSELVTNVVLHAQKPPEPASADMRVRLFSDRVRVEVWDEGPGFSPPPPKRPDDDATSGWGLQLVSAMADDWGVELGVQNCVWFELDRTPKRHLPAVTA